MRGGPSIALAAAVAAVGCTVASSDPGLRATLQLADAQFVPGSMPAAVDGPGVRQVNLAVYQVFPGAANLPLLGTLDPAATAVAVGLVGDRGYWVLTGDVPDTQTPDQPTFHTRMSFARTLAPGELTMIARAVDGRGRFGAPSTVKLTATDAPLPAGKLVVHLQWDSASDLDLRVVDPMGVEIWSRHASDGAGTLDVDSNSNCVIDGRNQENVIYPTSAPSGHYRVRVDAFSLCGEVAANWRAAALVDGQPIAQATGTSLDTDTRSAHDQGAGRTAFEIDLP